MDEGTNSVDICHIRDITQVYVETTVKEKSRGGGTTCCVPLCSSNSKRNPELSFYVIPKNTELRKRWLTLINRKNFNPSTSHRICSLHFEGGKKTYLNNCPAIFPKDLQHHCNMGKRKKFASYSSTQL